MPSTSDPQSRRDSSDNVFGMVPVRDGQASLAGRFLEGHDFSPHTRRAFTLDLRKFAAWFVEANREPLDVARVTTRDIADFRDYLRRERQQAVASVNRALVTLRRFFGWLGAPWALTSNSRATVKGPRRGAPAPPR